MQKMVSLLIKQTGTVVYVKRHSKCASQVDRYRHKSRKRINGKTVREPVNFLSRSPASSKLKDRKQDLRQDGSGKTASN